MLFEVEDFTVFRLAPLHKVCKLSFLKYSLIPFRKSASGLVLKSILCKFEQSCWVGYLLATVR